MITINTTNVSAHTLNGYVQKPNAPATSQEQPSFSLPAATVGLGLAAGIPTATYVLNRVELKKYNDGTERYGDKHFRQFIKKPDGSMVIGRVHPKEKENFSWFKFDLEGKLRNYSQGTSRLMGRHYTLREQFDENGKNIKTVFESPSLEALKAVDAMEMEVEGKKTFVVDMKTLGKNKDQILKELKPIIISDNVEVDGVKYMMIQGSAATAQERLNNLPLDARLPRDIPTQFKDVEKYLKDLQVKRSLIGLGIGSGLGVLAYLGVTQLTKPKTEKPS
jgi:hypothetical protein